jgi:hypothetical protein
MGLYLQYSPVMILLVENWVSDFGKVLKCPYLILPYHRVGPHCKGMSVVQYGMS